MSDFSYFSLFTAGLACLVPFTAAYTQPKGDSPVGNPFSQPGLNSVVPAGKEFVVTWEPTTKGTVTLVLLKGPSSNAVPQYAIVEKIDNTGTYTWNVADNLAPSPADTPAQGYGIELIVDATGQYQYTTQFGISNPDYKSGSSSSSSSSSKAATSTAPTAPAYAVPGMSTSSSESSKKTESSISTSSAASTKSAGTTNTPHTAPTSYPAHNVTMVAPTAYLPTQSTLSTSSTGASSYVKSTATSTGPSTSYTGGASTLAGGAFGAVAMAGLAVFAL